MLFNLVTMLLAGAAGWLWWKLSRVQEANVQLNAELSKLRLRLRTAGR